MLTLVFANTKPILEDPDKFKEEEVELDLDDMDFNDSTWWITILHLTLVLDLIIRFFGFEHVNTALEEIDFGALKEMEVERRPLIETKQKPEDNARENHLEQCVSTELQTKSNLTPAMV